MITRKLNKSMNKVKQVRQIVQNNNILFNGDGA